MLDELAHGDQRFQVFAGQARGAKAQPQADRAAHGALAELLQPAARARNVVVIERPTRCAHMDAVQCILRTGVGQELQRLRPVAVTRGLLLQGMLRLGGQRLQGCAQQHLLLGLAAVGLDQCMLQGQRGTQTV